MCLFHFIGCCSSKLIEEVTLGNCCFFLPAWNWPLFKRAAQQWLLDVLLRTGKMLYWELLSQCAAVKTPQSTPGQAWSWSGSLWWMTSHGCSGRLTSTLDVSAGVPQPARCFLFKRWSQIPAWAGFVSVKPTLAESDVKCSQALAYLPASSDLLSVWSLNLYTTNCKLVLKLI